MIYRTKDERGRVTSWREVSMQEWDRHSALSREILHLSQEKRIAFVVKAR